MRSFTSKASVAIGLCFLMQVMEAQNLIPNGEFSQRDTTYCTQPVLAFDMLSNWYNLGGLPYYFVKGCPIPEAFRRLGDSDQADYAAMGGVLHTRWRASSHGIGTELTESLTAKQKYYLEFSYMNRGIHHIEDSLLKICDTEPKQRMEVFFGYDSLPQLIDLQGEPTLTLTEKDFYSTQPTSTWRRLGTCYEAEGWERFIGFSLLRGEFETGPPCEYDPRVGFHYHWHNYLVDRFILEALPDTFEAQYFICENGNPLIFDASTAFDYRALTHVSFVWEDGFEGAQRTLDQAGIYHLDAQFECGPHPIKLNIIEQDCDPLIHIANAFSPNGDGENESIAPRIALEIPIEKFEWVVFDRWGRTVFRTREEGNQWDGRRLGMPSPEGVYAWRLTLTLMHEGRIRTYNRFGSITLIR